MPSDQISFTDVEYANRRRVSRREQFLDTMDSTIPWSRRVGLIEPFTYSSSRGRKPKALETMLRMYLLQAWFSLSDEGVENAIYDSYAMHRALKGNQWCFGMKAHIGVDAGAGYVHSMTATAASVHDLDQITHLVRADDEVVYADACYQGAERRPDVADDPHLSQVEFRVAARKSKLAAMAGPDRAAESRKASVRAKVERPFLIVKRDFGFTKTRYRGMAKNLNHLGVLFASADWVMRARAVALMG